jgi:hypothetical protein
LQAYPDEAGRDGLAGRLVWYAGMSEGIDSVRLYPGLQSTLLLPSKCAAIADHGHAL